jgi:hypothetical protein
MINVRQWGDEWLWSVYGENNTKFLGEGKEASEALAWREVCLFLGEGAKAAVLNLRARAEAAEALAAVLRAEVEAGVALASALRAEVEAGVALAVVRAEIAEVTLTTARAEGASLRDQLDDALRRAREAEAALATARAEGAAERAAVVRMLYEYRDHAAAHGRPGEAAVLAMVSEVIDAEAHLDQPEGA